MGQDGYSTSPGFLIRHLPQSRRRRMARLRATALAVIAAVAVTGIALQELGRPQPEGLTFAQAQPRPFDLFPG